MGLTLEKVVWDPIRKLLGLETIAQETDHPGDGPMTAEMKEKGFFTLADLFEGNVLGQKNRIDVDKIFRFGQFVGSKQGRYVSARNIWLSPSDELPVLNERVVPPADKRRKLTAVMVKDILSDHNDGESIRSLARRRGLSPATVWKIINDPLYWKQVK